jgi:hypothetical protein
MGQTVQSLVQEFDQDPFSVSRALRDLRDANPEAFEWAAFRSLAELSDSSGTRHLINLVQEDEILLRRVTNPHLLALPEAVRLIGTLRRSDPQTEVKLVRMITKDAEPVSDEITERVLDLIDAVTDSPKLVPVLMHLFKSAPNRIRARLAMTIGRHHRNREWVEERMRDEDSRVRANMVEVFWGEKSAEALDIFRAALQDDNPRVKGNAIVGLHRAGDLESLAALATLAASSNSADRVTAAWVMGTLRDPRFQKVLAQYVKDPDPQVRRRTFPALCEIKRHQESLKGRTSCTLRFVKLHRAAPAATAPDKGLIHILFEVKETGSQKAVRHIKPLDLLVSQNGTPVFDYQLVERIKYPTPGIYDLHFQSEFAKNPDQATQDSLTRMLKVEVAISTETHTGEHSSYWFGE